MQWFSARDRSTNLPAAYSCDEHRRGSLTRAWWKIRSRKVAQNHMKTFKVTSIWMDARSPSESFRVRSTGSPAHTERAETRALRCRFRIVQRTSLNGEFFGFFFFKITLFVHHQLQFSRTYRIFLYLVFYCCCFWRWSNVSVWIFFLFLFLLPIVITSTPSAGIDHSCQQDTVQHRTGQKFRQTIVLSRDNPTNM